MSTNPTILISEPVDTSSVPWWKKLSLEPVMFLYFFCNSLTGTVFSNQVIYRTCISMDFNKTDCALLGTANASKEIEDLEQIIQPAVASFMLISSITEALPPAIVSFFVGPWSDIYGRKPLVLSPLLGYASLYMGIFLIIWLLPDVNPYWFLVAYIPLALSGGTGAFITGIFGFLTDHCEEEKRALRMSLMEAAIFIGLFFGLIVTGPLYKHFGYLAVYGVALSSILFGFCYVWFTMNETVRNIPQGKSRFRALFDCSHIVVLFTVCLKKRDGYNRAILWMVTFALGTSVLVLYGGSDVNYLFVREQLHWTLAEYTTFNSVGIIVSVLGTIAGMYLLHKFFRISATALCIIGLISAMVEVLIRAAATATWHMYLGSAITLLRGVFSPMARALLAKVATSADVGKAYSLATTAEALSPLAAGPMYTALYKATLTTFPGAFNLLTAGIYLISVVMFITIYIMQTKSPKPDDTTPINQAPEYSINVENDEENDRFATQA